jgi:anthranilate phosphoribosyltransferase
MRYVGPVRKELGVATVMNLLGPLVNPAGVTRQVIGVAEPGRGPQIAQALASLGAEHALVVHAEVGMDEISTAGATRVWEVRSGKVTQWTIVPADYGHDWDDLVHLAGGDPQDNAARIERLLAGSTSSGNDEAGKRAVILNAAAGLYVSGAVDTYRDGIRMAAAVLAEGKAAEVLGRLRKG